MNNTDISDAITSNKIKEIYYEINNNNIENISLHDLELIMKLEKRDKEVKIDYKSIGTNHS